MTPATYRAREAVTFANETVTFANEAFTFANEDVTFVNEAVNFVNEDVVLSMRTRPAQQQARLRHARMPSTDISRGHAIHAKARHQNSCTQRLSLKV